MEQAQTRIMIVEDEKIVALDIKTRLQDLGYTVPIITSSAEEAIQKAGEINPDLALMDIRLRGTMDGVQAAEQFRRRFNIPVVYLTAYADEETLQRAKLTEPFGYLLKPFATRELYTTIEMALYRCKMEKRLRDSERRLATTLKSIGSAVLTTDAGGHVTFMNPVAERLTGWTEKEAYGQDLDRVFAVVNEDTETIIGGLIARITSQNEIVDIDPPSLLMTREGAMIPIDGSAASIRGGAGQIMGMVLVFRDITTRRRAEEALRRHTDELETRNEELDAFAHAVAYGLKHPLSVIIGFAEVLEQDHATMADMELQDYLRIILRNSVKMDSICDELLLLAEMRKLEVKMEPLDMEAIVANARQRLSYLIDQYQVEIALPRSWPTAMGCGPWVEVVWVNYLSNAIRYGGRPPYIELGATTLSGKVRFWVRDRGPGISTEVQARLFTPRTQPEQVHATGYGLGLSTAQRIVERLGGQVDVESEGIPGRGSTLSFTLPAARPPG